MVTKYDVFAEIIEKAPCQINKLGFKKPIYSQVNSLVKIGWIKKISGIITPIKNDKTLKAFKIIKYCIKKGINYNVFFSENMKKVLFQLNNNQSKLRPNKLKGNKENLKILDYLEKNQFILVVRKRPMEGVLLKHQLLDEFIIINKTKFFEEIILKKILLNLKPQLINPFDIKIFEFLTGSAQLEGSTVTIGETIDLIVKDIYPKKPQKDSQMVKNLNESIKYVINNIKEEITTNHLKELNKMTLFSLHANAGKYKVTQNKIQGNNYFKTANPREVPLLMENFCEILKGIKSRKDLLNNLGRIHNEFQRMHPFSDGNSRTARLIVNWMLIKNELPLLVLKMGSFDEYMNLTKLSHSRDDNRLNKLFLHILVHELIN